MEALALHTGAHTVHWEDNTSYISVVKSKRVTPSAVWTRSPELTKIGLKGSI